MGSGKKHKHSQSRSEDYHKKRSRSDEKLQVIQKQLDNLTNQLQGIIQSQNEEMPITGKLDVLFPHENHIHIPFF